MINCHKVTPDYSPTTITADFHLKSLFHYYLLLFFIPSSFVLIIPDVGPQFSTDEIIALLGDGDADS